MIQVTEGAIGLLHSVNSDLPQRTETQVLRLEALEDKRLGLMLGDPRDDDQVVADGPSELLHIASPLSTALDGGTIDRVDTPDGPRFGFTMDATPDARSESNGHLG
jgi:hypothetical protein